MKKSILLILLASVSMSWVQAAAPIVGPVLLSTAGYLATKDRSTGTQIAAVAGGALIGGLAQNYFENKQAKRDFKNYQLGMWQEAWIRDQLDWHQSTLDHRSGLPPAYDGHWAMFNGLPEYEAAFVRQREQMPDQYVPGDREAYINYLLEKSRQNDPDASTSGKDTVDIPTIKTIEPAKEHNGVKYRPRVREFPHLP